MQSAVRGTEKSKMSIETTYSDVIAICEKPHRAISFTEGGRLVYREEGKKVQPISLKESVAIFIELKKASPSDSSDKGAQLTWLDMIQSVLR